MALSAQILAELAFVRYQEKMRQEHPAVVKGRRIVKIPRDDGSVDYTFTEQIGPIEVERKDVMPLLSALAEAIVEHITEHGEVQSVTSGTITRNIT